MKKVNVPIPELLWQEVQKRAELSDNRVSEIVRDLCIDYIRNNPIENGSISKPESLETHLKQINGNAFSMRPNSVKVSRWLRNNQ